MSNIHVVKMSSASDGMAQGLADAAQNDPGRLGDQDGAAIVTQSQNKNMAKVSQVDQANFENSAA